MKKLLLLSLSFTALVFTSCKDEKVEEKTKGVDVNQSTPITETYNDAENKTKNAVVLTDQIAVNSVVNKNFVTKNDVIVPEKTISKSELLRQKHAKFLENSPFKKTNALSKSERKAMGITPNKYYESEWELTMDPSIGRPTPEKLTLIKKRLKKETDDIIASGRVPGDASDNNWIERGPTNVGGRVRALMFDPNDATTETVFAGGVSGGLWKNTNISNSSSVWTRVDIPDNLAVSCITYDPNNTNIFYVGTGESYVAGDVNGDGVWKSTNGGTTWTKVFGGISGPTVFQSSSNMTVNSPAGVAGTYVSVETSAFGPPIVAPMTSDIVLVNDGLSNPTSLGCLGLTNGAAISGKIALIRRGSCNFIQKIQNAQDSGAIAVIMMNNAPGTPLPMGGTDTGGAINIPSIMLSKADGDLIEAALLSNPINVTLLPSNGGLTGLIVPGKQHINDIKIRNNGGVSEIYVAAGDSFYASANSTTYLGGPEYGLFKSIDGGSNWTEVNLPLTVNNHKHSPNDIEIAADNKVWVSTTESVVYGDGGGIVFSSTDGNTFQQRLAITDGDRTQITVSKTTADKVYVLAEIPTGVTLRSTTNGFTTTNTLPLPVDADSGTPATDFTRGQAFYDLMLQVDPINDQIVYTGGIDLFKSTNGGTSWNQFTHWYGGFGYQDVHADQHVMAFANGSSSKMVFGNDGGVYFSNNSGALTDSRNDGLNITQFYTVAVAPTTNGMAGENFIGGAQDNGSQLLLNAPAGAGASTEVQGGDGAHVFFDQNTVGTDRYRITNYVYNQSINLYNYATNTSRVINSESTSNGAFICPMALDSSLDMLYADYTDAAVPTYRIRRYSNIKGPAAVTKASFTNALLTASPTAFTVSKYTTASTTLLIGTRNGKVLRLTNANTTPVWADISSVDFVGSVSDVEFGASNNEILVTMHNYNVASVWYTSDGGVTWQNKEGNLPDMPVKCILKNPLNANEVIVGTELGVWYTNTFNNASPTWLQAYNGMRNVKVTDLDLKNDNKVFASTYGRGIFSGLFTAAVLSNETFTNNENVSIYPNPVKDVLNINVKDFSGKVLVKIVDINGREVYNQNVADFNNTNVINLESLASGIYILKLQGENLNYSKKIILE